MGKFFRELNEEHVSFIRRQHMFFVATAPGDGGRINLSPKGYDSLVILDDRSLLFLDFVGSGNETGNHVGSDGRITFMWCSFDDRPLILRAYGYGTNIERDTSEYERLIRLHFRATDPASARRLVRVDVEAVQTSCGFGVPLYDYRGERPMMAEWTAKQVAQGTLAGYIRKNADRTEAKFPLRAAHELKSKE